MVLNQIFISLSMMLVVIMFDILQVSSVFIPPYKASSHLNKWNLNTFWITTTSRHIYPDNFQRWWNVSVVFFMMCVCGQHPPPPSKKKTIKKWIVWHLRKGKVWHLSSFLFHIMEIALNLYWNITNCRQRETANMAAKGNKQIHLSWF